MNKNSNFLFTKLSIVVVLCFFSFSLSAQLDKKHYIPPFFAPQRTANNVKEHWIVLSTQEDESFVVTIKRGTEDFREVSISKSAPQLIRLGSGFSSDANPTGVVNESGRNVVLTNEGFMLEAEKPFFTAIYQRSNAQGDVLTCKGETALGNEFYSGHIFGDFGLVSARAQFLTVMATFDNTSITFSNPRVKWDGQASNTFTVTLDKNESYALGASYEFAQDNNYPINDYNGTKVTSTKPIAVNSGSWMGSANTGNQQDIGFDQLVPQNFVGKKYIIVKGYGTERGEKVIVVASRPNTQLFVNDTLEHTFSQSGEYYIVNRDEYNTTTNNMAIEATDNIYVYQTLSGKNSDVAVGMCFIPPLSCLSNREVNMSFADNIGAPMLNIIAEIDSEIKINGINIKGTPQAVVGNPDWVTFRIDADDIKDYANPPSSFEIVSNKAINAALAFSEGAIGGAGFYSGFGVSPQLLAAPKVEGTLACYPANAIMKADGYDSYIWYYNNEVIEGEVLPTFYPTKTGQYRVSGTTGCGTTKASDPFVLKTCLSMEGGGVISEDAGDTKVLIRLGLPSDEDVEYWYRTVQGSAVEGEDFQQQIGVGNMLAGATEDSIFIELIDDERYEEANEDFKFEIYYSDNATIQNSTLNFTVVDDDSRPVLAIPQYGSVEEDGGEAVISIVKNGSTQDTVTVDFYTEDIGTNSVAGVYYTAISGTLRFAPGEFLKEIRVPIIDNIELNSTQLFNVRFSNEDNAQLTRTVTKVSIYDDEVATACLSLSTSSESIAEGDSIKLDVVLDSLLGVDVTYYLSLSYLTTNAADFVSNPADSMVMPAGESHQTFWIKTINDTDPENDEVFNVELIDVVNARSCTGAIGVTILNDDYIPDLHNDNYQCNEDGQVIGAVLVNDVILGDKPVVLTFSPPTEGVFVDNGDGRFTFSPEENYYGPINFSYGVLDQSGDSVSTNVLIMVAPENDVPIAINDTVETDEDTPLTIYPLTNDLDIDRTGLSIEEVSDNKLADVAINLETIIYTPHRNANGTDILQYEIMDTEGDPSFAKIVVKVNPVNDVPIAKNDNYRLEEDAAMTPLDVLLNDEDQDNSGLTITRVLNVTGGTAVLANNKIEYTLNANFWGDATMTYIIADGEGDTAVASVSIEVMATNDYPVANNDYLFTDEDVWLPLSLLDNDVDDDGLGLTIDSISPPMSGDISTNAGLLTYSPDLDFCGVDSFRYFIEDWNNDATFAWAKITVNCVNEAPRANEDHFILNEDDAMTILDVMQNDEDPDKSGIVIEEVFAETGGTILLNNDNKIEYTVEAEFYGDAGFTYVLRDGENDLDSVEAYITVLSANDMPIANADTIVTDEDNAIAFSLLANDVDVDRRGLLLDSMTTPKHGVLTTNVDMVTYTPNANYCGADSFLYFIADAEQDKAYAWVSIVVNCINDLPVANPDSFVIQEGDPVVLWDVLQNDIDADHNGISLFELYGVNDGTASIVTDMIEYTTHADFFGNTSLNYVLVDGENDKDTTTVFVEVVAINDYPIANDDLVSVDEDDSVVVALLDNDVDVDLSGLSIDSLYQPQNGELSNVAGVLTYIPNADYYGADSFLYSIQDGELDQDFAWVHITVNGVNDMPVSVEDSVWASEEIRTQFYPLLNDLDPDLGGISVIGVDSAINGHVTLVGGEFFYKSKENYNGLDSVSYTIADAQGDQSTSMIIFTVTEVNDYPVAFDDAITVTEDIPFSFDPLVNDTDVEDVLPSSFIVHQAPKLGTYELIGGEILYTPLPNIWGIDTMTYVAKDSLKAASNIASIIITIDSVNESPILVNVARNLDEDAHDSSDVVILAFDPDFSGLTLTRADNGTHGTASIFGDQLIYSPETNYYGVDTLKFYIADGEGDESSAWATYTVFPVNDAPVAFDDLVSVDEDVELVFNPLVNDEDVEEAILIDYTIIKTPTLGNYTLENGEIHYQAFLNLWGADTMSYVVRDSNRAVSNIAMIYITVDSVNESPILADLSSSLDEDHKDTSEVIIYAQDPDFSGLTLISAGGAQHGTAEVFGSTMIYSPELNFFGHDTLTYSVQDGEGDVTMALLSYNVLPVNDAPVAVNDTVSTDEDVTLDFYPAEFDIDVEGDVLSPITIFQAPSMGSYVLDGVKLSYTPDLNLWGNDTMTYLVKDSEGASSNVATIYITVDSVNESPILSDIHTNTDEDVNDTVDVMVYASSPDFSALTLVSTSGESNGTSRIYDNQIIYQPNLNYFGLDSLIYEVKDGEGDVTAAKLSIGIQSVNDAPVAFDDLISVIEDSLITFDPLANDIDIEDSLPSAFVVKQMPKLGTYELVDEQIIYTPFLNVWGVDTMTYVAMDSLRAVSNIASIIITIDSVNETPSPVNITRVLNEDAHDSSDVVILAFDPDFSGLALSRVENGLHGTASIFGDQLIYSPDTNYYGVDTVMFYIADGEGDDSSAWAAYEVLPVNDAPVAIDDLLNVDEDVELVFNPLVNDVDVEEAVLIDYTILKTPTFGNYSLENGEIHYQAFANLWGTDTMSYVVRDSNLAVSNTGFIYITVDSVNESPILVDLSSSLDEDHKDTTEVISSAVDIDFSGLTLTSAGGASNGTAAILGAKVIYSPSPNFYGLDTLTYNVQDGEGDISSAFLYYEVFPVNDYPVAINDYVSTNEDVTLEFDPSQADTDVEDAVMSSIVIYQEPSMGSYVLNGLTLSYTPDLNLWGNDTMTYLVKDSEGDSSNIATIYITVDSVNELPLLVNLSSSLDEDHKDTTEVVASAVDIDFSGLTLISAGGASNGSGAVLGTKVIYSPKLNFYGKDTLTYRVQDGEGDISSAFLSYEVFPVNDYPVAINDYVSTDEDVTLVFDPSQADNDVEDDVMSSIVIYQEPSMGAYVLNGLTLSYTPDLNLWGKDTMTYLVKDSEGDSSNIATIYITVDSVNEAPILSNTYSTTNEDNNDTVDVMINASSPDFSALTLVSSLDGLSGESSVYGDQIIYIPSLDFYGIDSLEYTVKDAEGDVSAATLIINVSSVNDAPVAFADSFDNIMGGAKPEAEISLPVTENDYDVDEDVMQGRVVVDVLPTNGTVDFSADNMNIIYTPNHLFLGYDSLSYRVIDTLNATSNQAWVTIFTDSFNFVPRTVNDSLELDEDGSITFNPIANDWDVYGDSLWATISDLAPTDGPSDMMLTQNGTVEVRNDTVWVYTPNPNYYGKDSAYYKANDLKGGRTTGTILMNVLPINDLPELKMPYDTVVYVENSGTQLLLSGLNVVEVDNDVLQKVEVIISDEDLSASIFSIASDLSVIQTNDTTGTALIMTLTSNALSLADWNTILRSFSYRNDSDDDTLRRQVKLVVWESPISHSDTLSLMLVMDPVNDAPENMVRPQLSGIVLPDSTITCSQGDWLDPDGEIAYCYSWKYLEDGVVKDIQNACSWSLDVPENVEDADAIWCDVLATDNGYPLPTKTIMASSDTLRPANYRPFGLTLTNQTIYRTMKVDSMVALLAVSDRDESQSHTYELRSGIDTLRIEGDTLLLDVAAYYLDAEELTFTIRVTDDGIANLARDFEVTITLINDLMPFMDDVYPVLNEVTGDSVSVSIRSDKPGMIYYSVIDRGSVLPTFDEVALAQSQVMAPNEVSVLSASSLASETYYEMVIYMTDTSGAHVSEMALVSFRTDDVTGPQLLAPAPYVVSCGVDSAVIAVSLNEEGILYYSLSENDTMVLVDSLNNAFDRIDTAFIMADNIDMVDAMQTYYFALDSLQSQMRYQLAFYALDTILNKSEVTYFDLCTRDTVSPIFVNASPIMEKVIDSRLEYAVRFNEAGTVRARVCDAKDDLADFSSIDSRGVYDVEFAVSENRLTTINTDVLPLDGIYRLDIMLEDSAGNVTDMHSLAFRYPEPFKIALHSEVMYLNEDLVFENFDGTTDYILYDLAGVPVQVGKVFKNNPKISIESIKPGVYVANFSSRWEQKSFRIMKINEERPVE